MNFDPSYILVAMAGAMKYIPIALLMAVVAMVIAVVVGLVLAFLRNSSNRGLRGWPAYIFRFFAPSRCWYSCS